MNQTKTGKLIAELRRQSKMTQQALGDKLGVSNKTVSRWENGNYMPDIELLPLIASEFGITVDELLSGERSAVPAKAEGKSAKSQTSSRFSVEEQKKYLKRKWRREHVFLYAVFAVIFISAAVILIAVGKPWLMIPTAPVILLLFYGWQNNRMMTYVEDHIYADYPKR